MNAKKTVILAAAGLACLFLAQNRSVEPSQTESVIKGNAEVPYLDDCFRE